MSKAKELKFEQAVEQLEQIIEGVESGDIGLEDSLAQYEKGMKLIGQCRSILAAAEKRIAELTHDSKGGLTINHDNDATDAPPDPGPIADPDASGAASTDRDEPV